MENKLYICRINLKNIKIMTLKEKIDNAIWTYSSGEVVDNLEQIAEEFAIGFAKYVLSQIYNMTHGDKAGISIEELLEIYKKTL